VLTPPRRRVPTHPSSKPHRTLSGGGGSGTRALCPARALGNVRLYVMPFPDAQGLIGSGRVVMFSFKEIVRRRCQTATPR